MAELHTFQNFAYMDLNNGSQLLRGGDCSFRFRTDLSR